VNERAVLRYEFAPNSNIYASYSNGFKSGAYNTLAFAPTPVNPESIDAYEVGIKTSQSNWRFEASAFYYDYSNLQFTAYKFVTINGLPQTISELENAAKATIYGGDAEATYNITPEFNVRLGGAWTHARYDSFPGAIEYVPNTLVVNGQTVLIGNHQIAADASGKTLIRAPEFTATLGANYTTALPYGSLTFSGNLYFSTRVYFDPNDTTSQPDYATLDLKLTWALPGDRWRISVFGDNVTDTKYVTQVAEDVFGYGAVYGTPAVVGIGVDTKF
jgi:iron complex outermembrane receptor protein